MSYMWERYYPDLKEKIILNCIAIWPSSSSSPFTNKLLSRPKGCNKHAKRSGTIL